MILEFKFVGIDTDYAASMTPVVTEKLVFYPIDMSRIIVDIKIGDVSLKLAGSSCSE